MKFRVDHDIHIHSQISLCSSDPGQTTERLLQYAKDNDLTTICVTDHFWDETIPGAIDWYKKQNYAHVAKALPLPTDDKVRFLFGVETEYSKEMTIGISPEHFDLFDFVIIPTTHFHMAGFTIREEDAVSPATRARAWVEKMDDLLSRDLPFHKIGIAHLACGLMAPTREGYLELLNLLPEEDLYRVFTKAAQVGVGIELNRSDMSFAEDEADTVLRVFRIAKACGCKFYCGSDAHHPDEFADAKAVFERAVDLLGLTEEDKFRII